VRDFRRRIRMIWALMRRGAWYGVWRFTTVTVYGLTHRCCKKCGRVKGYNVHPHCYSCQHDNFMAAMAEAIDELEDALPPGRMEDGR
jgi:hypothetical protein